MSSENINELRVASLPIDILVSERQLRSKGPEKHYFSPSNKPKSPQRQNSRTDSVSSQTQITRTPLPYDQTFDELDDAEVFKLFIATNRNLHTRRQDIETADNIQNLQAGADNATVQEAQNDGSANVKPVQVVQQVNLLQADGADNIEPNQALNQNLPAVVDNVQPPAVNQNIPNQQQNDQNVNNNDKCKKNLPV